MNLSDIPEILGDIDEILTADPADIGYLKALEFVVSKILTDYLGKHGDAVDTVLRQLRQELIDSVK